MTLQRFPTQFTAATEGWITDKHLRNIHVVCLEWNGNVDADSFRSIGDHGWRYFDREVANPDGGENKFRCIADFVRLGTWHDTNTSCFVSGALGRMGQHVGAPHFVTSEQEQEQQR